MKHINLFDPDGVKKILDNLNFRPSERMGQNFLVNPIVLKKIVAAADIKPSDEILEIGPGLGVLSWELCKTGAVITAVEKDLRLVQFLKKEFKNAKNFHLISSDIRDFNFQDYFGGRVYKVVANIPYRITGEIFRMFFDAPVKPALMVMLVQKEVGERICTFPGDMSILACVVQHYAKPSIIANVPKFDFYPVPEVDSTIIKIETTSKVYDREYERKLFRLVKIGFSAKRKTLKNNLASGFHEDKQVVTKILDDAGIPQKARAQNLSLKDWERLLGRMEDVIKTERV